MMGEPNDNLGGLSDQEVSALDALCEAAWEMRQSGMPEAALGDAISELAERLLGDDPDTLR